MGLKKEERVGWMKDVRRRSLEKEEADTEKRQKINSSQVEHRVGKSNKGYFHPKIIIKM